jgi:hypothetical protein
MVMAPRLRKLTLTAHVVSSVGWLGAVAAALGLGIAALTSQDPQLVRGVYLALEAMAWFVLVPLALASLLTGLVQSLGTNWGLFRHYWVVIKLAINVVASVVLLLYTQTLGFFADVAAQPDAGLAELRSPSAAIHSGAALLLLIAAAALSVYKPRGMTRYGWRRQRELRNRARDAPAASLPEV